MFASFYSLLCDHKLGFVFLSLLLSLFFSKRDEKYDHMFMWHYGLMKL
uniref:Uncharacterized protein n=1 Tax=Rhizophora mucronata TaxID=61149 RepID=A0A2P2Q675_RHIMU